MHGFAFHIICGQVTVGLTPPFDYIGLLV